jgi:NodT family efflux transporter outer membrane factor (OMF) lipoprotein
MLANAKKVLTYQEKRSALGAAAPLDVARQRASVQSMEAGRISYFVNMAETRNSLARLVGASEIPADIAALMDSENLMNMIPPAIDAGIPADLLARRPDVAEAEARLMAANANIGVARAAFLPGVSLTASAGWQSDLLSTLISSASALFSLAGSLLQPIFQGGKLLAQYDETVAAHRELMERYREAALAGNLEVATTLETNVLLQQQETHRHLSAVQSEEAYRIARLRYEAGAEDFLAVLDAQETKLNAESQVVQTRLERLNTAIALFKALGGGWMNEASPES